MKFRYTRFEKIYSSREEAIIKLNNTTRYYAENVAIRYKNGDSFETILALFRSETKGDYSINFDSGQQGSGEGAGRIFDRAVFDVMTPREWDLVIIHSEDVSDISYLYHAGVWICLTQDLVLNPHNSATVKLTVTKDDNAGSYDITAEVPIDNKSLYVDPFTEKLRIGVIDCGRLRDLKNQ